MTVSGFFAGVGGIEIGFKQAGFDIVWSNEIDEKASKTFRKNHSNLLVTDDIHNISSDSVPDTDIIVGGFPCQAFSVAGYRKGFEDERGEVFFQLARIISQKLPRVIFIENVKNLVGHDNGNTYKVIRETLESYGYHLKTMVLNACEYGNIPQNRERIYIIGFLNEEDFDNFKQISPINLTVKISDIVDYNAKVDDKFYYTEQNCSFYNLLKEGVTNKDTVYQWRRKYIRENKSNLCPTLTANMGTGGHNVPIVLTKYGIRKLTPKECFMFQGYPESFVLPDDVAQSHLYKQAGNSVVIPVIYRLASEIRKALKKTDKNKKINTSIKKDKNMTSAEKTTESIKNI
jgi:modification methylase bsp6I